MVCGGQSRLTKSQRLLGQLDIPETAVSLFRYRGHGNPGPTRVETHDGRVFEVSYLEMWEDEKTWDVETRCKFCPDALGEATDRSGGRRLAGEAPPPGKDEGFSGIIIRDQDWGIAG